MPPLHSRRRRCGIHSARCRAGTSHVTRHPPAWPVFMSNSSIMIRVNSSRRSLLQRQRGRSFPCGFVMARQNRCMAVHRCDGWPQPRRHCCRRAASDVVIATWPHRRFAVAKDPRHGRRANPPLPAFRKNRCVPGAGAGISSSDDQLPRPLPSAVTIRPRRPSGSPATSRTTCSCNSTSIAPHSPPIGMTTSNRHMQHKHPSHLITMNTIARNAASRRSLCL